MLFCNDSAKRAEASERWGQSYKTGVVWLLLWAGNTYWHAQIMLPLRWSDLGIIC